MTFSRCQLHPTLTCMPDTMRPFGIRAGPPLCAARAAATWSELVKETRKVSLETVNVASAPADGTVGVLPPYALAKQVETITAVTNVETCILNITHLLFDSTLWVFVIPLLRAACVLEFVVPTRPVIHNHLRHTACRVQLDLGISQ